jgi:hypothetical protein
LRGVGLLIRWLEVRKPWGGVGGNNVMAQMEMQKYAEGAMTEVLEVIELDVDQDYSTRFLSG